LSFLLPCPTCGPRPVDEYSYGGELTRRPEPGCEPRELFRTLYVRRNVAGEQAEWWFHAAGCREWFQAVRDTRTNEVLRVMRPPTPGAEAASEPAGAVHG
jgi:heterotetrameric sarcosine oxidase delta subunit